MLTNLLRNHPNLLHLITKRNRTMTDNPRSIFRHALALGALMLASSPLYAATCFVKTAADGGVAGNSGADWANAKTLQAAIDDANCDPIYVKGGVYKPTTTTDVNISFAINRPLKLYGGFAGTEATLTERVFDSANVSILSGDIDSNDTNTDGNFINETWNDIQGSNTLSLVVLSTANFSRTDTVINGFALTGGSRSGLVCDGSSGKNCSPTLEQLTVSGNSSNSYGGGLYFNAFSGSSSPYLSNITVSGNRTFSYGGGIAFYARSGNSGAEVVHSTIANNQASGGGGVFVDAASGGSAIPTFKNSIFWGNSASTGNQQYLLWSGMAQINSISPQGGNNCGSSGFSSCLNTFLTGDPLLSALQNNGSGMLTHMPAITGAAINAGDAATCDALDPKVDQRGVLRPGSSNLCDLGAVESTGICLVASDGDATADGKTWATATTLQSALGNDSANPKLCDEVWVKQGTYLPTTTADRDISFKIIRDIQVYGGFVGTETARAQRSTDSRLTMLSGDIGTANVHTDNTKKLLYLDGTVTSGTPITAATVIDGFTIQDAYDGTGIYCLGNGAGNECSPTVQNLTLTNNKAPDSGIGLGGAFFASAFGGGKSSPTITNVTFSRNQAFMGGAFALDTNGSGTSLPTFTNVTFANNTATDKGGALYVQGAIFAGSSNGKATLTHVTLTGNTAANGGAIGYTRVDSPASNRTATIEISNSVVWGNGAADDDFVNQGVFTGGGASTTLLRTVNEDTCDSGTTCTDTITADPVLGSLQDNSGGTDTVLPGATGSAVEAIAPADCTVTEDQRGIARPQGTNCDAGSVELRSLTTIIAFDTAPTVSVAGTGMVSVTSNSAGAITYSTTSTDCSVNSTTGEVTGIHAGSNNCMITASQVAAGEYSAESTSQTFSITKGEQTITNFISATANPVYAANDTFGVNASGGHSGNPVTFTVDASSSAVCSAGGANGAVITILAAGDCVVHANQAGNDDYNAATQVTETFTIAKAPQVITFGTQSPASQPFSDTTPFVLNPAATASSGLTVTYTSDTTGVCTISGTTINMVSTGTCTIRASQDGTGSTNYLAAADVLQHIGIGVLAQEITNFAATPTAPVFVNGGTGTFSVSATPGDSGEPVTFSSSTPAICTVNATNGTVTMLHAGDCQLVANQAGNSQYAAATAALTVTIAKADQTITFAAQTTPLGFATGRTFDLNPVATTNSGLPVSYVSTTPTVCSIDGSITVTMLTAGTCTVEAQQTGNDDFNAATAVQQSIELVKRTVLASVNGSGGSVSPVSQAIEDGATATITVTPDAGYSIGSVTGCGGSLSDNTYTTVAVTADCAVEATFINNNTPTVTWSLSSDTLAESTGAAFTVLFKLDQTTAQDVIINYTLAPSASSVGDVASDFDGVASSGSVTIATGALEATLSLPILDDDIVEPEELFELTASIDGNTATMQNSPTWPVTLTITDTDSAIITTQPVSVMENDGAVTVRFDLSSPVQGGFNVPYTTGDGSATAGQDYQTVVGSLSHDGDTRSSYTRSVTIVDDAIEEQTERFEIQFGTPICLFANCQVTAVSGSVDIIDDDTVTADGLSVTVSNGVNQVEEGQSLTYNIRVTNRSTEAAFNVPVTVAVPDALKNRTWTCTTDNCSFIDNSVPSQINTTVSLSAQGSAVIQLQAMTGSFDQTISVTASIGIPSGYIDASSDDNRMTDTDGKEVIFGGPFSGFESLSTP